MRTMMKQEQPRLRWQVMGHIAGQQAAIEGQNIQISAQLQNLELINKYKVSLSLFGSQSRHRKDRITFTISAREASPIPTPISVANHLLWPPFLPEAHSDLLQLSSLLILLFQPPMPAGIPWEPASQACQGNKEAREEGRLASYLHSPS